MTSRRQSPPDNASASNTISAKGFTPLLASSDFDDWRSKLRQVLGDCQVDLQRHAMHGFSAGIGLGSFGCLSLVELQHRGGKIALQRLQQHDTAVLWIPEVGAMEEQQIGATTLCSREWCNGPGQAMWIAPGTELRGLTATRSTGVSILVPRPLLAQLMGNGGATTVLNPFQTHRASTLVPLLRSARNLIDALRGQPAWLEHSAGVFWQALVQHSDLVHGSPPVESDASQAAHLSARFLEEARHTLRQDPGAPFQLGSLALALHVSPRTLQSRLRQELDATPRQAWECLRPELRQRT